MDTLSLTPDSMASRSRTEVIAQEDILDTTSQPILRLRLKKPKSGKKVGWRAGTVDNEHMGKKKSKCCCIYKKPTVFGESSSEDDEECEHCFGHPEKRRRNRKPTDDQPESNEHEHEHENEHSHNHSHKDENDKEIQNNNEETIK